MQPEEYTSTNYANLDSVASKIFFPKNKKEIFDILDYVTKNKKKILCIGSSLSWYDVHLNADNVIINLKNFEKIFDLDEKENILTVSSSFIIKEIINKLSSKKLSMHSLPGHLGVTIGGCVANNVHGKDTYKHGNFGCNIIDIEIILSNKNVVKCSNEINRKLFLSTIGGLGLTGIITKIRVKLKKITSSYKTENIMCNNYKNLLATLYKNREEYDYIYGWVDIFSTKKNIGRGVIFKSKKILDSDNSTVFFLSNKNFLNPLKILFFRFCIKYKLIKLLNFLFYYSHLLTNKEIKSYQSITSPLNDAAIDLKKSKICPPHSFFEIQVIIKEEKLATSLFEFVKKCQDLKLEGSIVGIKMHKKNSSYLSFSDNGISININHIFKHNDRQKISLKFQELHDFVIEKNFKVNIAKDFFFNKESFSQNYNNSNEFLINKKYYDKNNLFYSNFFGRITR